MFLLAIYLGVVCLASIVCFIAYALDKRRAVRGGVRIPERTLHVMELAGGWPGALVAQQLLRHKTRKTSFRIIFFLIVAVHLILLGGMIYVEAF